MSKTTVTPKPDRNEDTFAVDVGPLLEQRIGSDYKSDARYQDWLAEYIRGQAPYQITSSIPQQTKASGAANTGRW